MYGIFCWWLGWLPSFGCTTYLYTAQHLLLSRWWYHVQAPFAKQTIVCSADSPEFMPKLMARLIDVHKSMSNQVVYLAPNQQLYHCESGWEDGFRGRKPITVDSRFRYASVSKVVTSAMVLRLINQGKIDLNTKLIDILPQSHLADPKVADITIEMLLQHSAGFDRLKTYTPMLTMDVKPWCPTDLAKLADTKLDFEPNTQFRYSNVGYCLLGAIVERVTNQSFQQATEKTFSLSKRGIKFVQNGFLPDEIQYDYRYEDFYGDSYTKHFDFKDSLYAVGGLSGSAKQMVLLTHDLLNERPLNILSRSHTPCDMNVVESCYGYAMTIYQQAGHNFTQYDKSGYFPGVNTDLLVDDHGGILAIYRGASEPNHEVQEQMKKSIYRALEQYYSE